MTGARIAAVLRALADLAPGDTTPEYLVDVTGNGDQPFVWLGDNVDPGPLFGAGAAAAPVPLPWRYEEAAVDRLRSLDALHREERLLRAGWLFLCGPARLGGRVHRVCTPLLQRPVRITSQFVQPRIDQFGEPELTLPVDQRAGAIPLPWFGHQAAPPPKRGVFLEKPQEGPPPRLAATALAHHPAIQEWVRQVAAAAGLPPVDRIVGAVGDLGAARNGDRLIVVVGSGLFLAEAPRTTANQGALLEWSAVERIDRTALAHLYGLGRPAHPRQPDVRPPLQPLPLTHAQVDVVMRARQQPITVVSGAPGNGKSHAVCAIAIDAVAHGQSVLVATPTPFAADVLGELLERQPGPEPVLFGETEGRRRMIVALESLGERTVDSVDIDRRLRRTKEANDARLRAEAVVVGALDRETRAQRSARWTLQLPDLRAAVPGVFAPGADLAEVQRRVEAVRAKPSWWRRRRLRKLVGCAPIVGVNAIADAVEACADVRAELELDIIGGTTIGAAWEVLLDAEAADAAAEGELVDGLARSEDRWGGKGRRAVAALLRALPAGRSTRRDLLADIDAEALVGALPLWIGTLRDAEDLLPVRPGLFDLVIVDEAAQVDQFRAAGALLRARRAVVVGDPRQLRHVSFVADDDVAAALERHGVAGLADRLDVRRQSLFDVAAGAAPVTFLDEHHRSVPHLIDFSARRFYGGRVLVATRNPSNESDDVIDLVRVDDVATEVTTVVDLIGSMVAAGRVGIGAYTPFRPHADAIEAAVLDRFEPDVIEAHGLRTGTAHAAQGSERDHVIIAFGLSLDDPSARWRFAQDPNLFNVLVTRARRHLTVVTALPEAGVPRGIVADYLRHASAPPAPPASGPSPTPWVAALAAELERNHVPVRVGYPVGRWHVDICAGVEAHAVALDCAVHPDGPHSHLARHRALRRAGWQVLDAFPTRWDGDAVAAAVDLSRVLRPPGTSFPAGDEHP